MDFVLDGSTALRWCFASQRTSESDEILRRMPSSHAVVPAVWPLEIANAIYRESNKKSITPAVGLLFFERLESFPITVAPPISEPRMLFESARRHLLSAYDASYVLLAVELGIPLVTQDIQMRRAAIRAGVPLLI